MLDDPVHPPRRCLLQSIGGIIALSQFTGIGGGQEPGVTVNKDSNDVTLSNEFIGVEFKRENGGIKQIEAHQTNTYLRDPDGPAPAGIWELTFYHPEFDHLSTQSWLSGEPNIQTSQQSDMAQVQLSWDVDVPIRTHEDESYQEMFTGVVTVTTTIFAEEPTLYWTVDIENNASVAIRGVRCPHITNITELDSNGTDAIVAPIRMGRRVENPIPLSHRYAVRYPSGFGTMQFTAYTNPNGGFYFSAQDTGGHMKEFTWASQWTGDEHIHFHHEYKTPQRPGEDISIPYDTVLSPHQGDWYDAADRYREWFGNNGMLPESELSVPDWYRERGATIRGRSYQREEQSDEHDLTFAETAEGIIQARKRLGTPIQFDWWGYQTYGNIGFGDWFPPKEGWESFRETVEELKDHDILPYGITNVANLYESSDVWKEQPEEAETWVRRNPDQSKKSHISSQGIKTFRPHFTSKGWHDVIVENSQIWVEEGAKQLWIDGFPWYKPFRECYAESHEHPPGLFGSWWANECKLKFNKLREKIHEIDDTILFSGEGITDYFLGELDIQHSRDVVIETRGSMGFESEVIPLTQYTFGDFLLMRGILPYWLKTKPFTPTPKYLRLALARSAKWGALPNIRVALRSYHFQQDELYDEDLMEYASRIAWLFSLHGRRFLTGGELLRNVSIESPSTEVTATIGDQTEGEERNFITSSIHSSAWETAEDTERAVLLTNITEETETVYVSLTNHIFEGVDEPLFYVIRNGKYSRLNNADTRKVELELGFNDVVMLVAAPNTDDRDAALNRVVEAQEQFSPNEEGTELIAAQRAFVDGEFDEAISIAEDAIDQATEESDEEAVDSEDLDESQTPEYSDTRVPGFGIGKTLVGLGGTAYFLKRKLNIDKKDNTN
ncbi:hypothetical protein AArcSl_0647 [Halalkaliarchaeum desulfuricum]|uniref:DUF6259 domain-containing protein n=1 Tax=Halalkaliarchaeum desulfuricum TaxID=2055893 RepID=A0A343TGS5_9EURY|nr:DUF6259 domain-containing protein [Halalkaliarchaeum desulfuricum]AUX08297.1 hypothetical protein AArcSl_0647 [Halalkaliarchaeum desulfuricum]